MWVIVSVSPCLPFRPYLSQQFSICYDLYLWIHEDVQQHVSVALHCDSPTRHIKHTCPACSYKLKDEDELLFKILVTMDGNDSLKHIIQRLPVVTPAEGEVVPEGPHVGDSRELLDSRKVGGDYFVSREKVDKWAKEALEKPEPVSFSIQMIRYLLM